VVVVVTGAVSNKPVAKKSASTSPPGRKPVAPSEWVDVTEVAAMAGVVRGTIHVHVQHGTIPAPEMKVGNSYAWRRATIEQWLATRRRRGEHRS
jgi:predicted DNA-binding transcriptional regulator AlpA